MSLVEGNLAGWAARAVAGMGSFYKDLLAATMALDVQRVWAALGLSSEILRSADFWLLIALAFLTILAFFQLKIFSRPPPVPLKILPRRPALSILFKPDDISAVATITAPSVSRETSAVSSLKDAKKRADWYTTDSKSDFNFEDSQGDVSVHSATSVSTDASTTEMFMQYLPDSFAPLLSSSHTEVVLQQLTADLLHAVQAEASVQVREGRHEIPLNKNLRRPQLQLHSPKGGCRISVVAIVGSDNLSLEEDLDASRETNSRSQPMAKKAQLILDPPMPLANVAPTLIHIPTLFEDKKLPVLRRIHIVRMFMDFVISISSWLERLLWILESFCQIHLSNVQITPTFKGRELDNSPEWRLTLSFSGHVLLCGYIPIPFISVVLPTFIIPQPHALLSQLLSAQPLASAQLKRENIAEKRVALALVNIAESWNVDVKVVGTPPAVCLDLNLPGGGKRSFIPAMH
jgi:hypothetical protein